MTNDNEVQVVNEQGGQTQTTDDTNSWVPVGRGLKRTRIEGGYLYFEEFGRGIAFVPDLKGTSVA